MPDGIQIPITSTYSGDGVTKAISDVSRLDGITKSMTSSAQQAAAVWSKTDPYRNAASEISKLNNAAMGTTSGISTLTGAYRFLVGSVLTAGAVKFAKQTYELARMGTEVEFTRQRFDNLSRTIGTTGDAFLNDLRVATKGTVSDFDLLKQGTNLLNLDLANTRAEAIRLSRVMSGLGMDTGELTLALANQSVKRLDQLNVSYAKFKEIKDKVASETGLTGQQLFQEAFLQSAEFGLQQMGDRGDTKYGDVLRAEARIANAKAGLGQWLASWVFPDKPYQGLPGASAFMKGTSDYNRLGRAPLGLPFIPQYGGGAGRPGNEMARDSSYAAMARYYMAPKADVGEGATLDYGALLDGALKITTQTEKFTEATAELNQELEAENAKLATMTEKYGENSEKVAEQAKKVNDIKEEIKAVKTAGVDMGNAMLLSSITAKEGNEELALQYAFASGMITKEAYNQQSAILKISEALQDNKITADVAAKAVNKVMSADGFQGKMTMDIYINYIVSGGGGKKNQVMIGDSLMISGGAGGAQREERRAKGGPLGGVTMVGEEGYEYIVKRGNEYVVIPHEASVWMAKAGIMPEMGMATGGMIASASDRTGSRSRIFSATRKAAAGGGVVSVGGGEAAEAVSAIIPEVIDEVGATVQDALASSAQLSALSDSVAELKSVNETLIALLAKTASAGDIGRAVNGDMARQA